VQNANIANVKISYDDKIHAVYATNDFIVVTKPFVAALYYSPSR